MNLFNIFNNRNYIIVALVALPCVLFAQDQDSLLQQVQNIDISLNSPPDSEENLYLNTVSFQSFYDLLSPVGEWIQISKGEIDEDLSNGDGQGFSSQMDDDQTVFIWKPSGMESNWHPYTDGKWVYTASGWVWASNYHWGWAVYHYGRWWHSSTMGWVWIPGHVWAPAWVVWRITEGHIGWCPLSPKAEWKASTGISETNYRYSPSAADWVFVEKSRFLDEVNSSTVISSSRNSELIEKSKTVLNIRVESNMVVHSGPQVDEIEKATGQQVIIRSLKFTNDKSQQGLTDQSIVIYNEPLKRFNSIEEKADKDEKPASFKATERAQRIIHHRVKIKHGDRK